MSPGSGFSIGLLTTWPRDAARGSGTAVAVRRLGAGLERLGHRVRWLTPEARNPGPLTRLRYNLLLPFRGATAGLDLVAGVDLDGLLLRGSVPFALLLKGVKVDEARFEEGMAALRLRTQGALEAVHARAADQVVVPSRYSRRVVLARYGLDPVRVGVAPEAVDVERWETLRREAPEPWPDPTVLSVARAFPRKRLDLLIDALPRIREQVPGARLRLVTDGPGRRELEGRVRARGMDDAVTFRSGLSDDELAREYLRAWCFALPSEQEAFGIAVLEAMAAGLPVVATEAGALPELVRPDTTGVLVEPGEVGPLAEALVRLLADDELRGSQGVEAARVARHYDVERQATSFLRVVSPLLASGGAGVPSAPSPGSHPSPSWR